MSSLVEHTQPLDLRLTKHLLRRACFHYSKSDLDQLVGKTADEILTLISLTPTFTMQWPNDPVTNGSLSQCPGFQDGFWLNSGTWTNTSFQCGQVRKRSLVAGWWWYNCINQNTLVDKLTWFLFTTFTISKDDGSGKSAHFFDYLNLLQFYADKSVKDLARKITFDNSMLYYLDNSDNNKNNPNENYAREFLELFTIGKGEQVSDGDYTNYTEHDVIQAARVFSGIKFKNNRDNYDSDTVKAPHYISGIPKGFINTNKHDTGNKTFSYAFNNQTITGGNTSSSIESELDDFVEMIFNKIETAKNYVRKLYRMFVRSEWGQDIEDNVITPLAQQLQSNGYNLLEVTKTLLKSKHFFDLDDNDSTNENIGGIIKNPLQFISELIKLLGVNLPNPNTPQTLQGSGYDTSNENFRYYIFWHSFLHNSFFASTGMSPFAPATVAGYPGDYQPPAYDKAWFNPNNIVARYNTILSFIGQDYSDNLGNGINRIIGVQTNQNGAQYYQRIWTFFNPINFLENSVTDPFDAIKIVEELSELFYCESILNSDGTLSDRVSYFVKFLIHDNEPNYVWYDTWDAYKNGNSTDSQNALVTIKNRLAGQDGLIPKMINAAEFQLM